MLENKSEGMNLSYWRLAVKYPNYIGFGALNYFYSSLGKTFLISLFIPYLIEHYSIDNSVFSYIYSAATLLGAMGLIFLGPLADRIDLRKMSVANGLILAMLCVAVSVFNNVWILLLILTGLRVIGYGLMPLIGAVSIGRYFDLNRGKALSLSYSFTSIAEMTTPLLIFMMITSLGWSQTWIIFATIVVFTFIPATLFTLKDAKEFRNPLQANQNSKRKMSIANLARDIRFVVLVFIVIFSPFLTTGVFIHQNMLMGLRGWEEAWFAVSLVSFGVFRVLFTFFAGPMIDKYSAGNLAYVLLIPVIIGLVALQWMDNRFALIVFMCANGITLSVGNLLSSVLWAELYDVRYLASINSFVSSVMIVATALSPIFFSYIFSSNELAYSGLNLLIFVSVVLLVVAKPCIDSLTQKVNA
ncbi:MFS transporter [Aureibacter tunicatorum]|uniref:MFS family permease n=1 Tax=Aureibacter tunicatorum TaxID=866807 RepID=A0AAE3XPT9_9BACT|nr:MFS transporter [Aureibacter tunicatorum]MDR6240468.1 MFS family permease [Aureibacter tunicatorum]BDD05653.1 hypothetical protein AUTU_31360 [Aureibacter tunicatorum]